MMTKHELAEHLTALNLAPAEAALLLGVSARTLRREVSPPVEAALRAWRMLNDRRLAWKPDHVSIFEDDQDQIDRHRRHTQEIARVIERVVRRGGPKHLWAVDLAKGTATFGPFVVGFYHLQSGGFSVSTYSRKDMQPDADRDMAEIEDAAYCISNAFTRAADSGSALRAVAAYTRQHASKSARTGPNMLGPERAARHADHIVALADDIDKLADVASNGKASYERFEAILSDLHTAGFFPKLELLSDVARAMV